MIPFFATWRKEWDSNPRYSIAVRRISSPVHSITLASFLDFGCKSNTFFVWLYAMRPYFFQKTPKWLVFRKILHIFAAEIINQLRI